MLCLTAADFSDQRALKVVVLCAAGKVCLDRGQQVDTYLKMSKLVIPVTETPSKGSMCGLAH